MSAPIIDPADLPHDNIQAQAVAIIFVFPAVATLAVALRLYSRALIRAFALGMALSILVTAFNGHHH